MKERYTYEISVCDEDNRWRQDVLTDTMFHREPRAVARSLLESWVIDNPGRLTGGERILVRNLEEDPEAAAETDDEGAKVRVRVFRGGLRDHQPQPAAIGFLRHDEHDFGAYDLPNPLDRLKTKGKELAAHERVRKARTVAKKAVRDPRVGTGAAAVLALLAGWAVTRKLRGRRGPS